MIDGFLQGLTITFSLIGLLSLVVGVLVGIIVGVLPGIGPTLGMALLVPFTYDMSAANAVILLISIYVGAEYGGAITSILIAVPGNAAAAATVLDGHPLARQGRAAFALEVSLTASCVGGLFSGIAALLFLDLLGDLVLRFAAPAYFAVALLALTSIGSLGGKSQIKGLLSAFAGLAIASIGIDSMTGIARFTFSTPELLEGIPLVPAVIGLFALAEMLEMFHQKIVVLERPKVLRTMLTLKEWVQLMPAMLRGSAIGTITGVLPGMGATVGSWVAYDMEKRLSKTPEKFGDGAPEGVAAPEAANNSAVGGALVPLLALGIPSTSTTAILIGALILHGVQPGPRMMLEAPDVGYGLIATCCVSVVVMYILGNTMIPLWTRLAMIPQSVMTAIVLVLCVLGAYSERNLMFDVWIALCFGVLGYFMKMYKFPSAPLILALVIYKIIESNFRRSLLMSNGDLSIFVLDPISLMFLVATLLVLVGPLLKNLALRIKAA